MRFIVDVGKSVCDGIMLCLIVLANLLKAHKYHSFESDSLLEISQVYFLLYTFGLLLFMFYNTKGIPKGKCVIAWRR